MFRFTTRELLLVTALLATALGWVIDRHLNAGSREYIADLRREIANQKQWHDNLIAECYKKGVVITDRGRRGISLWIPKSEPAKALPRPD